MSSRFVLLSSKSSTDTVAPVLKTDYIALANLFAILAQGTASTNDILAALGAYQGTENDVINALTNGELDDFNESAAASNFTQLYNGFMDGFENLADNPEDAYEQVVAGEDSFAELMTLFLQALANYTTA